VEVEALALELHGAADVEEQAFQSQLRQIDKEINSHKRQLSSFSDHPAKPSANEDR